MAEHRAPDPSTKAPRADPGDRGALTIADRVVERIATLAAGEVRGVVTTGSTLDGAVGRRYPKTDADVAGNRARVHVEVALSWPHSAAEIAAAVRDTVRDRLQQLAAVEVDAVDVTAAKILPRTRGETARRVQ